MCNISHQVLLAYVTSRGLFFWNEVAVQGPMFTHVCYDLTPRGLPYLASHQSRIAAEIWTLFLWMSQALTKGLASRSSVFYYRILPLQSTRSPEQALCKCPDCPSLPWSAWRGSGVVGAAPAPDCSGWGKWAARRPSGSPPAAPPPPWTIYTIDWWPVPIHLHQPHPPRRILPEQFIQ